MSSAKSTCTQSQRKSRINWNTSWFVFYHQPNFDETDHSVADRDIRQYTPCSRKVNHYNFCHSLTKRGPTLITFAVLLAKLIAKSTQAKLLPYYVYVSRRKLSWFRRCLPSLPKRILHGKGDGGRPRGMMHKLWRVNIKERTGQLLPSLLHIADDRSLWPSVWVLRMTLGRHGC